MADRKWTVISWEGDSRALLRSWPRDVQRDLGFSLRRLQEGKLPMLASRPMKSIGPGIFELKAADEAKWYRVIYAAHIGDMLYVLDSFTKQSRKTENVDLNRARARFIAVKRRLEEERSRAKHKATQ